MNDFKYFELIENYTEGNLSEEDCRGFEKLLAWNNQLHLEFELYQNALAYCEQLKRNYLKKTLKDLAIEETARKSKKESIYYFSKIAASFIIILFTSCTLISNLMFCNNCLFPKENLSFIFSGQRFPDSNLVSNEISVQLSKLYENENYEEIIQFLKSTSADSFPNDKKILLLAHIKYLRGDYTEQELLLQQLLKERTNAYEDYVEWMLIQSAIKAGEIEKANQLLTKIEMDSNHQFQLKAKKLAKRLNHPLRHLVF